MIRTFTIVAALAALPVLALAQQPEKPVAPPDSAVQKTTSEGRLDPALTAPRTLGLTDEQVRQLQDALNSQGCREGMATGLVDSATKGGVVCARQKLHVNSYRLNDVLQALHLPFTAKGDPDIRAWASGKPANTHMGMPMKHDSAMGHDTTSHHR